MRLCRYSRSWFLSSSNGDLGDILHDRMGSFVRRYIWIVVHDLDTYTYVSIATPCVDGKSPRSPQMLDASTVRLAHWN